MARDPDGDTRRISEMENCIKQKRKREPRAGRRTKLAGLASSYSWHVVGKKNNQRIDICTAYLRTNYASIRGNYDGLRLPLSRSLLCSASVLHATFTWNFVLEFEPLYAHESLFSRQLGNIRVCMYSTVSQFPFCISEFVFNRVVTPPFLSTCAPPREIFNSKLLYIKNSRLILYDLISFCWRSFSTRRPSYSFLLVFSFRREFAYLFERASFEWNLGRDEKSPI